MSQFRTTITPVPAAHKIALNDSLVFVGSCFSSAIGKWLMENKFSTLINPFGTLYNPVSISECISQLTEQKLYTDEDLFVYENTWLSLSHYTRFSSDNKDKCLEMINSSVIHGHAFLSNADWLIITPGTAMVYQLKSEGRIVANCHKLPSGLFIRKMLDLDTMVSSLVSAINKLRKQNSGIQIIFTLSPVRHWNLGAEDNFLSKSLLRIAIDRVMADIAGCTYFPAYEIMMDDLRDYRFYSADMLHLNETAQDYIRQKFADAFLSDEARQLVADLQPLHSARNHRPVNSRSKGFILFLDHYHKLIRSLEERYPMINFDEDKQYFENIARKEQEQMKDKRG